jgi:peptide/nickel transport system substrate-binding protein
MLDRLIRVCLTPLMVSMQTVEASRTRRPGMRAVVALLMALVVPFALAACAPSTTTSSGEKIIRVGWKSDIDTLNPLTTVTTEAVEVQSLIYDKLLDYGLDLKQEPSLATESKRDGSTITYTLRDGVKWQDGEPFTADDVVYTFDTIGKNQLGINAQFLTDYVSAEAVDPKTVKVTFKQPQAFDPGLVIPILPKHIWSKMTPDQMTKFTNDKPIGTGPYKFGTRKQGQNVSLVRNDDWWGEKPAASGITWSVYTNDDLEAQALKNGEIDIIPQVPPTVFDGLKGDKALTTQELPSFSFHHIGMNVSQDAKSKGNPLLKDKAVRQALGYALDRNQIVELAYAGYAEPGDSILMPAFGDYYWKPAADQVINNDLAKANTILDAAGYTKKDANGTRLAPDGKPLEFRLIAIDSTSTDVRTAQLFQATAAKAGIKLDFSTVDSDTMASTVYNTDGPDWDMFVWGWDSGVNDPSYMLGVPLTSQIGGNNDIFYSNPEYDALYAKQATELDPAKRAEIVKQMQQMFYDDSAYLIPVYLKKLQAYRNDTWTGWTPVPGGIIFNFTRDNYLKVKPGS